MQGVHVLGKEVTGFVDTGKHRNREWYEWSSPSLDLSLKFGSFSVSLFRVWVSTSLWPGKSGPEYPSLAEDPGAGCTAQVAKMLCSTLSTPYAKATAEFSNLFVWYCEFEWICNMRISVGGSTVGYMGVLEGDFNFLSRWAAAPWSRWDKDCSHLLLSARLR